MKNIIYQGSWAQASNQNNHAKLNTNPNVMCTPNNNSRTKLTVAEMCGTFKKCPPLNRIPVYKSDNNNRKVKKAFNF
jgi:hypothetical protein